MNRRLAVSLRCLTLVCALGLIGSGKVDALATQGSQKSGGPSLQETLDYINPKYEDTPRYRNGSLSVSADHRTLTSRYEFREHESGKDVWITNDATIAVKDIDRIGRLSNYDNYSEIFIECAGVSFCARGNGTTTGFQVLVKASSFPADAEQAARLVRAFQHLVDLLKAEQPKGGPDPFAK
jgi:hypothetical protein